MNRINTARLLRIEDHAHASAGVQYAISDYAMCDDGRDPPPAYHEAGVLTPAEWEREYCR